MVKVLLVGDQRLFIEGLRAILSKERDIEVVGLLSGVEAILGEVDRLKPDVILMDIHMPQHNGIEATFQVKAKYPHVKVVLLTTFAEEELIIFGVHAGADGFLMKELDREQLIRALQDVNYGHPVISGEAARILAKRILDLEYDQKDILDERLKKQHIHLTTRELEIATLLMEGATNKHIAETLVLSEGTIKNYISDLYSKADIHNRKEFIHFLRGLVN
ncbi:response regulator transcription factor [Virgibacillus kimchii]